MNVIVLLECPSWLDIHKIPEDLFILILGEKSYTLENFKEIKLKSFDVLEIIYNIVKIMQDNSNKGKYSIYLNIPENYQQLLKKDVDIEFYQTLSDFFSDYLRRLHPSDKDLLDLISDLIICNSINLIENNLNNVMKSTIDKNLILMCVDYKRSIKNLNSITFYLQEPQLSTQCILSPVKCTYLSILKKLSKHFVSKKLEFDVFEQYEIQGVIKVIKFKTVIKFDCLTVQTADFLLLKHSLESGSKTMLDLIAQLMIQRSPLFDFQNESERCYWINIISPFDDFFLVQEKDLKSVYICDRTKLFFEGKRFILDDACKSGITAPIVPNFIPEVKLYNRNYRGLRDGNSFDFTNGDNYKFFEFFPNNPEKYLNNAILFSQNLKTDKLNVSIIRNNTEIFVKFQFFSKYDALRYIVALEKPEIIYDHNIIESFEPWRRETGSQNYPNTFYRMGETQQRVSYKLETIFNLHRPMDAENA
eukprot:NODE_195_length_13287_cov_0.482484.p3 type:complete len:475 gc:universal NODE_195_length_13287_cov_0.482484:7727-9151(+)